MERDDAPVSLGRHPVPANDNHAPLSPEAEAALTLVARAIGRQLAREAMRAAQAANDNDPPGRSGRERVRG